MKLSRLAVYVSDTNHLNIGTVLVQYTLLYNTPARCCLGNYMTRLSLRPSLPHNSTHWWRLLGSFTSSPHHGARHPALRYSTRMQ